MAHYVSIRTSQNVIIEYEVATVWDRIVAYIIDALVMFAYILFMAMIVGALGNDADLGIIGVLGIIMLIPLMFYSLIFEVFNNGQSPGKALVHIQVVSLDGSPVTIGQYLTRWLFRLVDLHLFSTLVAVIAVATSSKGQRIGDIAAATTVINKKKRHHLKSMSFEKISESYDPIYSEAANLSSQDIETIKEVLANKSENRFDLIVTLAAKIEEVLNVTKTESSETFLRSIVKDYNYYHSNE